MLSKSEDRRTQDPKSVLTDSFQMKKEDLSRWRIIFKDSIRMVFRRPFWLDSSSVRLIILIGIYSNLKIFWKASKLGRFYLWKPKILIVWANMIDGLSSLIFQRLEITLIDSVQRVDGKNSFGKCQRLWKHEGVFKANSSVVRSSAWKKSFKVWIS